MKSEKCKSLSGDRFLLQETLKVIRLILTDKNWDDVRKNIESNNLFGYRSEKSVKRVLSAIKTRLEDTDEELLKIMKNDPHPEVINLYLMMKSNLLLMNFMKNVIQEKYALGREKLTTREIREFLESVECTSNWSEKTFKRSVSEIKNILKRSGIIDERMKVYRPILSNRFRDYIIKKEGKSFLKIFGEGI